MSNPNDCRYTDEHEWAKVDGTKVRVGITDYAQTELGDVVFVDLPQVGAKCQKGQSFCNVESVKAVSDIYAPVDGVVVAVNEKLSANPELINQAPFVDGWIAEIAECNLGQLESLKSAAEYTTYIASLSK